MPKKTKKCQGFEAFQRINYLFQIRNYMATEVKNTTLATYYGGLIDSLAKKSVIRIDPNIKREICKRCKGPLIPNETATIKIESHKRTSAVIWKCKQCMHSKKYMANQNKKIWYDNPNSIVEILNYANDDKTEEVPKEKDSVV